MDIDYIISTQFINLEFQPCILRSNYEQLRFDVYKYIIAKYGSGFMSKTLAIISQWFKDHKDEFIIVDNNLTRILSLPQIEQRTDLWLQLRYDLVTASILARAIGLCGKASRNTLLYSKICRSSEFKGTYPTERGNRLEPVTNLLYTDITGRSVHDVGLVRHKTIPYIGASSDGIDEYGTNIEIKNVKSREITDDVPIGYWCQCQCQMEVLDLDITNFVEVNTDNNELSAFAGSNIELQSIIDFVTPMINTTRFGIYSEYYNAKTKEFEYRYSNICKNIDDVTNFIETTDRSLIYIRSQAWSLNKISIKEISRNKHWFQSILPLIKQFNDELLHYRTLPIDHPDILTLLSKDKRSEIIKNNMFSKKCLINI